MKTLYVFLLSLFSFQALLFAPAATEARSLLTIEKWSSCWFMRAGSEGRHKHPPPPPHYSPGPTPGLLLLSKSPPPRRHSPPPPVPGYSPGHMPGLHRSSPRPFNNNVVIKDSVHHDDDKSLPNDDPYAAASVSMN